MMSTNNGWMEIKIIIKKKVTLYTVDSSIINSLTSSLLFSFFIFYDILLIPVFHRLLASLVGIQMQRILQRMFSVQESKKKRFIQHARSCFPVLI